MTTKQSSSHISGTSPPTRPSQRDRKRADIVAAAKEVFFKEGYAHASMDEITARSGVSKATVYAHYGSKDELLMAVVEDVVHSVRAVMTDLPQKSEDFRGWLTQLGRIASEQITSPEALAIHRLAITESVRFPEIAQAFQRSAAAAALDGVAIKGFAAAMANGTLRKGDPERAVEHFFEMCFAKRMRDVLMGLAPIPTSREIERAVTAGVEAFLYGYAGDETATRPKAKRSAK